jgi:hypothetical protein
MTLPYERTYAVRNAKQFLLDLCDPKKTPRIPKEIRRCAGSLLKHYPSNFDLDRVIDKAPDVFGKPEDFFPNK